MMPRHRELARRLSALALIGAVAFNVSLSATGHASVTAPAFSAVPQEKEKDTVRLKDGKSETGKIESENYNGVMLGSKLIAWSNVQSVEYAGGGDYTMALQSLTAGKLDDALAKLEDVLAATPKPRPMLRQNAMLNIAQILQRQGKTDDAIAAYRELLDAFPDGRYLRTAGDGLVACLMSKKDASGASAALDKIGEGAKGVDAFKPELAVMRARLLELAKKPAEAKAAYESAAGATGAVAQEAQLGLARCLAADGKGSDALAICDKLKTVASAPNYVLAGAWNGIGDVWSEQGRTTKNSDMLHEALIAYMRGVVQYAPLPGEPSIEYERALAGSARCFKFIAQLDTNPERKKTSEKRSSERIQILRANYPSSMFLEGL